jgi:FixJ family two-component response regulator
VSARIRSVVVVDDEEPVRKALCRLLRVSGLHAVAFSSGQSFLNSIGAIRPDCVVLDLHMQPGLSGLQVLEQLRSSGSRVPVIITTGQDEPQTEERCLSAGAAAYLRKPLDGELLLATIDRAIIGGAMDEQDGLGRP